jgi:hypothetical protein
MMELGRRNCHGRYFDVASNTLQFNFYMVHQCFYCKHVPLLKYILGIFFPSPALRGVELGGRTSAFKNKGPNSR